MVAPAAQAAITVNFDNLTNSGYATQIPDGYQGFRWDNFYAINTNDFADEVGPNGYTNGTVSGPNVAFNYGGSPASILTSSTPFTLNSGYFTGAWNNGLNITVQGLDSNNAVIDMTSFTVNATGPSLETFNRAGLSSVTFSSSAGTSAGYNLDGEQFALDNLTLDGPIPDAFSAPEPSQFATLGMICLGLADLLLRARKRQAA